MKKNVVFLTGAGLSKESGIDTFRDAVNGRWKMFNIHEVCTYSAWQKDPSTVQDFYNLRRIEVLNANPNKAHFDLANFQKYHSDEFNITHVTQNVDDLLERAGATNVIHVHGELLKARSSDPIYDWMGLSDKEYVNNPKLYDVGYEGLNIYKNVDAKGFPLRPHVVLFGEQLIRYNEAVEAIEQADYLVVIGTSLVVHPVAAFPHLTKDECKLYYVDPTNDFDVNDWVNPTIHIKETATTGVDIVLDEILFDVI